MIHNKALAYHRDILRPPVLLEKPSRTLKAHILKKRSFPLFPPPASYFPQTEAVAAATSAFTGCVFYESVNS